MNEQQILYFRACRGFLADQSARTVAEAAGRIIGAQSQLLAPALHALSMRTETRPPASKIKRELFQQPRSLVRCWGQRDTLFMFPANDWPKTSAGLRLLAPGGRGFAAPPDKALEKARKQIDSAGRPLTRRDLYAVTPASFIKAIAESTPLDQQQAKHFAAGQLFQRLSQRGHVCVAEKQGSEQSYAARTLWHPDLKWKDWQPEDAAARLVCDYLSVHGPATPHDIAHFFGAKVTMVRKLLAKIQKQTTLVDCGQRERLVLLAADEEALNQTPPKSAAAWPLRLLPAYESMLMAHADKSWTVPSEADRKQVWRKSAVVAAVILDRGRVIASWNHKATKKRLNVTVTPLTEWRKSKLPAVRREAKALAKHLEVQDCEVSIED